MSKCRHTLIRLRALSYGAFSFRNLNAPFANHRQLRCQLASRYTRFLRGRVRKFSFCFGFVAERVFEKVARYQPTQTFEVDDQR
jgi:hypothetical protein